ncbi:MAG: 50S ribosomal protein L13 [Nitrososphaerota archaeon]
MIVKNKDELLIIDGSGHRLGRLASRVAKMLLEGKKVVIVNARDVVITGSKSAILERYNKLIGRTWYSSLSKIQVWFPRRSDRILWYTIARMLPRKKAKGREALKRLKIYSGTPEKYMNANKMKIDDALHKSEVSRSGKIIRAYRLIEIAKLIGSKEK